MSRMFCTWKEAARTLHTSEDQIRTLVERGILREFREGPHRFVRESDIEVLRGLPNATSRVWEPSSVQRTEEVEAGAQRTEDRGQTTDDAVVRPPSSVLQDPSCATAVARPPRVRKTKTRRLKTQNRRLKDERRKRESRRQTAEDRGRKVEDRVIRRPTPGLQETSAVVHAVSPNRRRGVAEKLPPAGFGMQAPKPGPSSPCPSPSIAPALSVRQWFWMGLVQDRPMAIALLAGLVLLVLSALAAGVCLLAERF